MRLPKARTLAYFLAVIRDSCFLTPAQRAVRAHFSRGRTGRTATKAPIVLVQCIEDNFYFALFGKIIAGMRACGPLRVELYSLRGLRAGSSASLRRLFWNSMGQNGLSDWKWRRLNGAFADGTAYLAAGWVFPWTALWLWGSAWRLWRGLKSVEDLAVLKSGEIWIGDLVIDSYLRFKPAPSIELSDPYLLVVIRQALKNILKSNAYFSRTKPALYLTSYTTYIQHGIPARVAVRQGIPVRAFSNLQEPFTEIARGKLWHTRDAQNYKRDFLALPDKEGKIGVAEHLLNERMGGKIDSATSYMKQSAYGRPAMTQVEVKGKPVLFLHDFYDSVHIYRWICFHDFWNWACFTIDTLREAGIEFAVKPHPNQVDDSSGVLIKLAAKYPGLNFIPTDVGNDQLIASGMACAVTVYGTVASEMAFKGIPAISCGDSPHIGFDFCHTARSLEDYAALLRNCRNLPGSPDQRRRESCAFYYMHNLHLSRDELLLKEKIMELRRQLLFVRSPPPAQEIINAADAFAAGPALQAFCSSLYGLLQGPAAQQSGEQQLGQGLSI